MDRIETRLAGELIAGGLNQTDAVRIAGELLPQVKAFIKGRNMLYALSGVSFDAIATRVNAAYPKITKGDYGLYNVATNVIKKNPTWTEDQVYNEVIKSFQPKSAGGLLVTKQESVQAIADRETTRRLMWAGGIGAAVVLFMVLKKKKRS